ncbi:hypothetical protein GCM10025869_26010 [Homoserinibacter gongjuensis]|uniref:MarR family transcriptional regulator n=1 Tax=Homoserinibacter gongjuensis TaxID=1162968 RepID=A0ABQ6JZF5_9MICO|nr:hypothetical protein GCM10025869_26010 [Homoserinibacter gongjuensis]
MTRLVPRLDAEESAAWLSLVTMLELLPRALDSQLQRDSGMTHFEFAVLSFLRFSPDQTLRMSQLATGTNATLPGSRTSSPVSNTAGSSSASPTPMTAAPRTCA